MTAAINGDGRAASPSARAAAETPTGLNFRLQNAFFGEICGNRSRNDDGSVETRSAMHQLDSRTCNRRGPEGQQRASRDADGYGARGLRAVDAFSAPQPAQPEMVRPRPVRSFRGPRLDAALCAALPYRLRPAAG